MQQPINKIMIKSDIINDIIDIPNCFIISSNHLEDNIQINTLNRKLWTYTVKGWYHNSAVIIKKIKNPTQANFDEFKRTVYMSFQMHHPNIVHFYGISYNESEKMLSYVTEYLSEGTLSSVLKSYKLNCQQIIKIMLDVAKGMCYLHSKTVPIIHRDIRAENIHIGCTLNAKITNLEFCGLYRADKLLIGTPAWTAPEIIKGNTEYTTKVDVYSYSMLFVEILNRSTPYNESDLSTRVILKKIINENYRPQIHNIQQWPSGFISLIESCWQDNPDNRPCFNEIINILLYKI